MQFSVVAGYQISWAIYVSDYSRYLPPDVTVRKTFYWTYGGSALGAVWIMCIGAALAAWAGNGVHRHRHPRAADVRRPRLPRLRRDHPGLLRARAALGDGAEHVRRLADPDQRLRLVQAGAADPQRPRRHRHAHRRALAGRSRWPAPSRSSTNFENFLLLVLYFFIPWTAVNLVDYFIVRHGHYAIAEIFKPARHLRPLGLARDHLLPRRLRGDGAVLQHRDVFTGWVANAANGADFSLFIGLPVSGDPLLGAVAATSTSTPRAALAEREADELEAEADAAPASRDRMTRR